MTLPPRQSYQLNIFEKLGTPLLAAVAEATERDRLAALQNGQSTDNIGGATDEADRIASLLKSSAEMGFSLSRQVDLRMLEADAADGVRLTLATIAAPLIANLYRVNGRIPSTPDVDRMVGAMQAVTLFADNYNAAADANARLSALEQDFAPADAAQVQVMMIHALMPAMNAICTFSFGQPEKAAMQTVMDRLNATVKALRADMFSDLSERDGLRAELSLLRAAATLYSQAHYTEMSRLMFMDEQDRDQVDLQARFADMWRVVETRLSMMRLLAQTLVTGTSVPPATSASSGAGVAPSVPQQPKTTPAGGGSPFAAFTTPPATPSVPVQSPADTGQKASPFAAFTKPKETAGGAG